MISILIDIHIDVLLHTFGGVSIAVPRSQACFELIQFRFCNSPHIRLIVCVCVFQVWWEKVQVECICVIDLIIVAAIATPNNVRYHPNEVFHIKAIHHKDQTNH